jgi:DNA-binding transcriptional LysR family regulator
MRSPLDTSELLAFTQTVDARSLSRAALELRLPRTTLSRRLARLEKRLGTRLLRRSTRSLALTDAGEALYRHARIVLEAAAAAEASVRRPDGALVGDLRVTVPPLPDEQLFELLATFARQHPGLRVQVHATSRHVDLLRDGYDAAIRAGGSTPPGLVARPLFRLRRVAVASPAYLAEHGTPRTAGELRRHRCLMGFAQGELPQTHWRIDGRQVHLEGVFFSNDLNLLCAAAALGDGITVVPHLFAAARLESGALVQVLQKVNLGTDTVAIVYAERELLPASVRAFVDALTAWKPRGA